MLTGAFGIREDLNSVNVDSIEAEGRLKRCLLGMSISRYGKPLDTLYEVFATCGLAVDLQILRRTDSGRYLKLSFYLAQDKRQTRTPPPRQDPRHARLKHPQAGWLEACSAAFGFTGQLTGRFLRKNKFESGAFLQTVKRRLARHARPTLLRSFLRRRDCWPKGLLA